MSTGSWIIIIVIVIVVLGGAYYFYAKPGATNYTVPTMPTMPTTPPSAAPSTPSNPGQVTTVEVTIQNLAFSPQTVAVAAGSTVRWTNKDSVDHQIASDTGAFGSSLLANGQTYSFTFTQAGTYPYHCAIHPFMTATVIVQ